MKKALFLLVIFFSLKSTAQLGHLIDSGLYVSGTLYIDDNNDHVDSLGYQIMVRVHNGMLIFFKGTEHEVWRPSKFLYYKEDIGPVFQGTDVKLLDCKSRIAISRYKGIPVLLIQKDDSSFLAVGLAKKIME